VGPLVLAHHQGQTAIIAAHQAALHAPHDQAGEPLDGTAMQQVTVQSLESSWQAVNRRWIC